MVHGTVHLDDGEIVIIMAEDMLTALKRATERYHGRAMRMDFKTMKETKLDFVGVPPPVGGWCKCGRFIFASRHDECPGCGRVL